MVAIDPVFRRDKFLLRQKLLSISEKYDVCDEQGNPILFVERPAHFWQNLIAVLAGVGAGIVLIILMAAIASALPKTLSNTLATFLAIVSTLIWFFGMFGVSVALSKKRHVTIYRDASKQDALIRIRQDKKWEFPTTTFTVRDDRGDLAIFRKYYFYDLFRKRWNCYSPDGSLICVAKEDSLAMALIRRLLGPMFGLLRTHFIICEGDTDRVVGEFNRNFTLLDRYVLDMSGDPDRHIDRRIAIALGVILDTGERR